MNERDIGRGADLDGFDGDGITTDETTDVVDFASMVTTRLGRSICQNAASAGRIGDGIAEFGRDTPPNEEPQMRTMRLIAADTRCAEAGREFEDIIEHLREVRKYLQEQAANSHANETP